MCAGRLDTDTTTDPRSACIHVNGWIINVKSRSNCKGRWFLPKVALPISSLPSARHDLHQMFICFFDSLANDLKNTPYSLIHEFTIPWSLGGYSYRDTRDLILRCNCGFAAVDGDAMVNH